MRTLSWEVREPLAEYGRVSDAKAVAQVVRDYMERTGLDFEQETFLVFSLTARHSIRSVQVVGLGTMTACLVHPREVFRAAIVEGAVSIIVAHTHPSGDVTPSDEDHALTLRLREAGDLLGIPLLDHVVVTAHAHRSCI